MNKFFIALTAAILIASGNIGQVDALRSKAQLYSKSDASEDRSRFGSSRGLRTRRTVRIRRYGGGYSYGGYGYVAVVGMGHQDAMSEVIEGVIIGVISLFLVCIITCLRICGCVKSDDDEEIIIIEEEIHEDGGPVEETKKEIAYPPGFGPGSAPPTAPPA